MSAVKDRVQRTNKFTMDARVKERRNAARAVKVGKAVIEEREADEEIRETLTGVSKKIARKKAVKK